MRATAKPSAVDAGPESEPASSVMKTRKRRAPRSAAKREAVQPSSGAALKPLSSGGALKPLLIGVGVGSAVVLLANAIQGRQGARAPRKASSTLLGAFAKTAAVAVARLVAKRVARDLARRALPELANRAIVHLSARAARA